MRQLFRCVHISLHMESNNQYCVQISRYPRRPVKVKTTSGTDHFKGLKLIMFLDMQFNNQKLEVEQYNSLLQGYQHASVGLW
jgi:hypothetical protein